eukprot:2711113-Rhodomonas_salina.1
MILAAVAHVLDVVVAPFGAAHSVGGHLGVVGAGVGLPSAILGDVARPGGREAHDRRAFVDVVTLLRRRAVRSRAGVRHVAEAVGIPTLGPFLRDLVVGHALLE